MSIVRPIMREARIWRRNVPVVLFAGLVLFLACSDDDSSVGPEPEPLALVEGIAYFDVGVRDLKYVEKRGEYWGDPEVVAYGGNVGYYSSLAFDAQGVPHISYYYGSNQDLMYAVRTSYGWRRFTVDYNGDVGGRCAIALDAGGNPHICYRDATRNDSVKYASLVDGVWKIETVPGEPMLGGLIPCLEDYSFPTSIAIDAGGNPHISYYTVSEKLGYAVKTTAGWSFEIADDSAQVGRQCSLALDAQGNPHISYIDQPNQHLKYARKYAGQWQSETIQTGDVRPGSCADVTSLVIDVQGNPHISYNTSFRLGYAWKSAEGSWSVDFADYTFDVGRFSSLALDAQGNPRISYYDAGNQCLKYALKVGNDWAYGVIDQMGNVGYYSSLALCYR